MVLAMHQSVIPKNEIKTMVPNLSSVPPETPEEYKTQDFHVYRRRWYILSLYSLFCLFQCMVWNTFGPIAFAAKFAYGWSDATLAWMLSWASIAFLVFLVPVSYLTERWGLRLALIMVSFLVLVGTAGRTFSNDVFVLEVMSHICAVLNGVAGIVVMSAPSAVAATWFPENERIFATSIAQGLNMLGNGISYLVGPKVVSFNETASDDKQQVTVDDTREDIRNYMIAYAVIAAVFFILFLVYFPSKPDKPPCASSSVPRNKYKEGWKDILTSRNAWLVCAIYAIPGGVQSSWQGMMAVNYEHLGVSATEIGNVGFITTLVQGAVAICIAFVQDGFRGKIKTSLIVLFSASTICFVWLALICFEVIPYSLWQLYAATVIGSSTFYSCIPLCYELAVMIVYPSPENLVGAFLSGTYNLVGVVFLFVFFIPDIGTQWVNYLLVITTALSVPLVVITRKPEDFVVAKEVQKSISYAKAINELILKRS